MPSLSARFLSTYLEVFSRWKYGKIVSKFDLANCWERNRLDMFRHYRRFGGAWLTAVTQIVEVIKSMLIFKILFGITFIVLFAEFIRPGVVINTSTITRYFKSDHFLVSQPKSSPPKIILFWTQYFSKDFTADLQHRKDAQAELDLCSVKNCLFTHNKSLIQRSDAVLFHIRDLLDVEWPVTRDANQYYIFYLLESPLHTLWDLRTLEGVFNLTFTYRHDADLPIYDYHKSFHPVLWTKTETGDEFWQLWSRKIQFATSFISYCSAPSFRHLYLEELAQFIPIDIFGSCGTKSCDPTNPKYCDGLVTTYKFYLALENSVCKDYMTEKVYRALNYGTIPVVYGGANYTAILPPGSFINVLDFDGPQKLAHYLRFLASDPREYEKYFQWRYDARFLTIPARLKSEDISWCRLCKLLNKKKRPRKIIKSFTTIWNAATDCAFPGVTTDKNTGVTKWLANPAVNFP